MDIVFVTRVTEFCENKMGHDLREFENVQLGRVLLT